MLNSKNEMLEGRRELMAKEGITRVVLADDHTVVRQGLKRLLNRAPEIQVIGEASDGQEALNYVKELQPDVLLLDIEMPVIDGIEVARRLHELQSKVRILILSAYDDREYVRALLDIGVSGYLVKGEAPGKIVEAVRGVAQGQKGWVSPQVRLKFEKMQGPVYGQARLTYRELEILRLLAAGYSNLAISNKIGAGELEISALIQALLQKIGAQTREEAIEIALREGLISKTDRI
jgi:DNA-binding NarL/FixJ family response regulator